MLIMVLSPRKAKKSSEVLCGVQAECSPGGGSAAGKQKGAPLLSEMPVSEESELGWAQQQQGLEGVGR